MISTRAISSPLVSPSSKISGECFFGGNNQPVPTGLGRCYNEAAFPAPHTYDPERFLNDGRLDAPVWDPEDSVFGSGRRYAFHAVIRFCYSLRSRVNSRRICPGQYLALRAFFLNIACTLAVFNISAPIDEKLEAKYDESLVR